MSAEAPRSRRQRRASAPSDEGDDTQGAPAPASPPTGAAARAAARREKRGPSQVGSNEEEEEAAPAAAAAPTSRRARRATATPTKDEADGKPLTAIERARKARQERTRTPAQEEEDEESGAPAAAEGGSRRRRRQQAEADLPASADADGEGEEDPAALKRSGTLRERLGMKALAVKTVKPPVSPGSTPRKQPLGENNEAGGSNRSQFKRLLSRGSLSAPDTAATDDEADDDASPAPATAAAAAAPPRRASALGGMFRATSLARRLAMRSRTGRLDEDELPPFDAANLFEDGDAALARIEGQLTAVTVHGTDELPHDWRIAHPLMSVHVINGYTGRPLRKSNVERAAVTSHERVGGSEAPLAHIMPVLTKPFTLRGASGRLPCWEEELVLQESFSYLLHPRVYMFFELLDFAPDSDNDAGLTPYAWGFLKMISGSMAAPAHANALRPMPLRLQLYRWQKRIRPQPGQPAVWAQYLAAGRRAYGYSSTAYITVRPLPPPQSIPVRFPHRPMAPHHVEEGRIPFETLQMQTARDRALPMGPNAVTASLVSTPGGIGPEAQWLAATTNRGGAPCLLPNALLHALPGGALGATAVAMSPDGALVAIALADNGFATLAIHEVQSGRRREAFHAHHRTIHELCWTADGECVVSVSADFTAKVWPARRVLDDDMPAEDDALATLEHPSYVYCARTQPRGAMPPRANAGAPDSVGGVAAPSLLVTGANDHGLRLWDISGEKAELLATKTAHKARINAVAWPNESTIYSADGAGVLKQWEVKTRAGGGSGADLELVTSIEKKELRDVAINSITLHPNRRRLLLQTRNHQLLALDTRLQHFAARYEGHRVGDYHIRATYSPDGRFVVAGSEDGRFFAWAEESGHLLLDGLPVGLSGPLLQISWSSQHDTVALCGFGPDNPALLYYHDPLAAAQNPLLAAAAAAAASTATSTMPAMGGQGQGGLTGSVDGRRISAGGAAGGVADGTMSLGAEDRAKQREARRAARRTGGDVPAAGGGLFPGAELGTTIEQPGSSRKAAAAELRRSRERTASS